MFECKVFFVSILTLKFAELYLPAAVTKTYQCTQQDVQQIMGKSLTNAPRRVKRSEKKFQAAKEESYPGEIELKNKGSNEN